MSALLRRGHPLPSLAADRPPAPALFVLRSRPQDDGAMWPAHATRCQRALPAALQWAAPLLDAHQPLAVPCSEEQVRALFHWLDSLPNTERVSVCCERRLR